MRNFEKALIIRREILEKQKKFCFFLKNSNKDNSIFKHCPLYYPEAYADKYQEYQYKKQFLNKSLHVRIFNQISFAFFIFLKSEIRFLSRLMEFLLIPLIALIFKHKNNKNSRTKNIYTLYSTNNQNSNKELIEYFVPKGFLKKNEQIFIEAFDVNNLISAFFISRRLCEDKQTNSIFSSNPIFLSFTGIFILFYQYFYIKYLFIKILFRKPEFLYLYFASYSKLWSISNVLSLIQPISFLNNLNYYSHQYTNITLWWEGHFHNWCSLGSIKDTANISIFWPNPPSKTSYSNLSLIPPCDSYFKYKKNQIRNIYNRKIINPDSSIKEKIFNKEKLFVNKNIVIATGHSFEEIQDCNSLYKYLKTKKTKVSVKIHPHFLKNNLKDIIHHYPEIYKSHQKNKDISSLIFECNMVMSTLDSISYLALSNKKIILPIISTKYITYMNILEFNPNVIFIDKDNKIYIEKFKSYN